MEQTQAGQVGRPRSEHSRQAVLHAVDDLLVEVGYSAMTLKGIAARAGVGRQTLYRWWSSKAEILLEASAVDAREELTVAPSGDLRRDVAAYVHALVQFLAHSPSGVAYRALIGEAQHDAEVAALMATQDILGDSARAVLAPSLGARRSAAARRTLDHAAALLVGPVFYQVVSGRDAGRLDPAALVDTVVTALGGAA